MGDTEKTAVETSPSKGKEANEKAEKTDKTRKNGLLAGVKSELKFVKWPTKAALIRDTSAVLVISVLLGAVISLVDVVIKFGIDKLLGIG